ncbi:phenylacetic acid degradation protein, partial [Mycobacterium sp. ITM-2017-0098]
IGETGGAAAVLVQRDDPVLNNSVGAVHGGVSSMGLELVGSAAVNKSVVEDRAAQPYRTASLRVNFLRPFHGGGEAHY